MLLRNSGSRSILSEIPVETLEKICEKPGRHTFEVPDKADHLFESDISERAFELAASGMASIPAMTGDGSSSNLSCSY
jgi:hypothetical protein